MKCPRRLFVPTLTTRPSLTAITGARSLEKMSIDRCVALDSTTMAALPLPTTWRLRDTAPA
jgi:hypothetical protein